MHKIEGKRVAFLTLGCKVNSYETEGMRELFLKAGAVETEFTKEADIYVVNTCSVTNMADRKSRQMLHRAKKNNPSALVVAAGCYAQAAGETLSTQEGIDLVVGNNQKAKIVELTAEALEKKEERLCALLDIGKEKEYEELPIETVTERTRAYIKIEDGCNQFCSYCIIPYVRGRVRSRGEGEILAEITRLAKEGYKEVVLTGIHLSSYGLSQFDATLADTAEGESKVLPLLALLKKVQELPGIERIRLGSLEPRIMTEAFVKELASLSKICPHFHLSLQSGCDATLKRMNRKYTTTEYRQAVEYLRMYFDKPAITTDIIVGFPGETEEEFAETLLFARDIAFSQIHIFKYSRRAGTVADRMEHQVPEQIKSERSDALEAVEKELREAYIRQFDGAEETVLSEEATVLDCVRYMTGHTTRYVKVFVKDRDGVLQENETVRVKIYGDKIGDGVAAEQLGPA
ncbi:MAG: tRNA (N(6)-L-threonylcarbamoyladenosine(37)-C(2))-methylthiotransferase MtaB [Lachnospiraceae bacterium]|nr:tRNA (N(6)-L-threonylcarbamoyladenosine(37)-C(2))-methylthiotransferase MtaB [Lachnospiraceae bacterium]